jgi:hypothetical protein
MTWLPEGYSLTPPPHAVTLADVQPIPNRQYGGADRSTAVDGSGRRFRACCAWKAKNLLRSDEVEFGSRIFAEQPDGSYKEVIYWGAGRPFCQGRGEINTQGDYDFVIDQSGVDSIGPIPGWVDAVSGPRGATITVESGTPIYQLYLGEYTSDAEVLGKPGLYVRLNKLLLALRQIVAILETTGVIRKG